MTDSQSNISVEENALEDNGNEEEGVEHLYPIQNMDILYDGGSADEDSMQNPADLVETQMPDESEEYEGVMVDADGYTGEIFNENSSSNQELQNETYAEDFMYSNDDGSNSNIEGVKEDGKAGSPLGRFNTIAKAVEAAEYEILQVLYQLLYQRSAWDTQEILSQRILEFSGFNFSQSSEEYFNREMMLQTQPNDVLVKLTVLLGLDTEQNCRQDVDKSRPGFIRCIMSFLSKPCKKTRKRVPSGDNTWKLLPPRSSCGCRSNCYRKISKGQRQIILDYVKDLTEKRQLDSYLVNMITLAKIPRRPGSHEHLKRLRDVCYTYYVKYGTRELTVCKGAFTSIYNLSQSKMIQLQNKMKSGKNLPPKMDLEDFPPMPLYDPRKRSQEEEEEEEEDEDAVESETYVPKRKRSNKDKEYNPSEDSDESEDSDGDIEAINKGSFSDNDNQNASPSRSSKGEDKNKKENVQLKDFPLVVKAIDNSSKELLIDVHFLLYLNSADEDEAKARILEFSGFPFDFDSEEYDERKEFLQRMSFKMVVDVARSFSLSIGNNKESTINNILCFLVKPDESLLRISAPMPVSLSDVELDDIDGMSDSDVSITCEVVEKKVECIDILSSDESDGESKKGEPQSSSAKAVHIKQEVVPIKNNATGILRNVYQKPHNGTRALKDYETIKIFIDSYPLDYLNDIFNLLYMKPSPPSMIRHEILEFNGFSFDKQSVPFMKRRQLLDRMLYNSVRRIYNTLIYKPTDGRVLPKPQMVSEILEFLMELPHPDSRKKALQDKSSSVTASNLSPKPSIALQQSTSTYTKKTTKPLISVPVNPPAVPPADVAGLKSGKLSDLKRVFQRVACFPCEYLTDVHKLLFMMDCDPSMIRQNIFAFRGFSFAPDSEDFRKRKNYLEYLTFHSLRKISSVLTTKSVDLRNSTKHELVTHLAEVLSEYCDKSASGPTPVYANRKYSKTTSTSPPKYREIQPKASVPSNDKVTEKNSSLFFDNSDVENIVVTPLIDPSITGIPSSEMSTTFINAAQDIPKGITITERPLKIVEAHSVVPESSSKRKSTSPYRPSKKVALAENSVVQKLEQCQQVYGTTVSLIPAGSGPAITGIMYSGGIVSQGVQYPALAPSIVSTTVSPQIITTQATNSPIEEKYPLPSNVLQNEKTLKQNPNVTCLSDDEDCDKPLSSLVGYPIDSVLEKHVDDIVKNSDLQSITINGVIKKINDMYPKFDLSYRKEFLKSTVRSLLYRLGQEKSDLKRNTDSPDCSVTTTECIDSDSKSLECQVE